MHRLLLILLLLGNLSSVADELTLADQEGNDISVQVVPAEGDLLMIWLVDHDEPRPMFEEMLQSIVRAGIELWRVDLLESYFLPRSSENIRTLGGEGVAVVLDAAHANSDKRILLASYDRMPLPLLRGVRQWQAKSASSRLAGAILFYPNLFGPPPVAGEAPVVDPILSATNIPLAVFQPALGSHRWRMQEVLSSLWQGGSPAYLYLVPEVRDWFFMGEDESARTASETKATARIPAQVKHFAKLFEGHAKPLSPLPLTGDEPASRVIRSLVRLETPKPAPPFFLSDSKGHPLDSASLKGDVVLLNFWATWCPPCVEEIPSLNRLKAHFSDTDLRIVSIDFRETPDEMAAFLNRIPVDFPVLMDQDGLTSLAWQVFSFPSSFIIDRTGQIRFTANRAINWDSQEVVDTLTQLLAE